MTKTLDSPHSSDRRIIDYAVMNQLLFEGKHKEVKAMTEEALASGRPVGRSLFSPDRNETFLCARSAQRANSESQSRWNRN